jgi:hypothetical protein
MPTSWVQNILPNASTSAPLQLWFNNINSVWLPCIVWHAGQVRVFDGVSYCQRLHNLEISTPRHQLNNCDGCRSIPTPFQNLCHSRYNLASLLISNVLGLAGWNSCQRNIHNAFYRLQPSHSALLRKHVVHTFACAGGYNPIMWREWILLILQGKDNWWTRFNTTVHNLQDRRRQLQL